MYRNTSKPGSPLRLYHKIMRIMRLTTLLIIASFLQVSAAGFAQKISMNVSNISLKLAFKAIRSQSGYNFVCTDEVFRSSRPVSLNVKEQDFEKVMAEIFNAQPLSYQIEQRTVVVKLKSRSSAPENLLVGFQAVDIKGKVVDSLGNGLAGATVRVKNGKSSASTDAGGNFLLKNVDEVAVLVVSYLGYLTKEVTAGKETNYIVLKQSESKLDEVQVIAYGTTSRRMSTGNVDVVTAKEIENQPVNNPLLALQGRVPGLNIQQSVGLSGGAVNVRIRGNNSIANGNEPFYVVDGVPYTSSMISDLGSILRASDNSPANGNPLSFINPNDIESISILKDADATAIYGSRAANGAVLITTKRGRAGEIKADFAAKSGWGKVASRAEVLNTSQYLEMRHEALRNDLKQADPDVDYDLFDKYGWSTTRERDWQKELLGHTAGYQDYNARLSGGSENTQYLFGTTYHRETTVFSGDFSDRKTSAHFNLNTGSNDKRFRFQLTSNFMLGNNQLPDQDLTFAAIKLAPNAPDLTDAQGNVLWQLNESGGMTFFNPLYSSLSRYRAKTSNLLTNANLRYELIPGLEVMTSFGYNELRSDDISTMPIAGYPPPYLPFVQRSAKYGNGKLSSYIVEPQILYKGRIAKGSIQLLAGASFQENENTFQRLEGSGYNSDLSLGSSQSASFISVGATTESLYRYQALFGRATYEWDNKYLVNFNIRRDGSSRFGSDNLYHNFASVGLGWIFSNESWIKQQSILSFGKLRGSFGTTGSDKIPDYVFLSLYSPVTGTRPYQGVNGLLPDGITNPAIQWEETRKLEGALELGFLKDRILLKTSVYRNRSENQLIGYSLPVITGVERVYMNFPAVVQNAGWEVSLTAVNIMRPQGLNWSTSFNLSRERNQLIAFPGIERSTYSSSLVIGQPTTILKTQQLLGVDGSTGIYNFSSSTGDPQQPGDDDAQTLVDNLPRFYGGLQNSISFKGLTLDFLLQFVKQTGNNYNYGVGVPGVFAQGQGNQPVTVLNRWQEQGDQKTVQRYTTTFDYSRQSDLAQLSNGIYTDASFIRLKNVSLSYQLPLGWLRPAKIKSASIFFQGQNLLLITRYKGLDPETQVLSALPPLKVFVLGLNFGF